MSERTHELKIYANDHHKTARPGELILREMAERDGPDAVAELTKQYDKAMELVP
jgi:hypothetical protein